jgi:hypothetical protein
MTVLRRVLLVLSVAAALFLLWLTYAVFATFSTVFGPEVGAMVTWAQMAPWLLILGIAILWYVLSRGK